MNFNRFLTRKFVLSSTSVSSFFFCNYLNSTAQCKESHLLPLTLVALNGNKPLAYEVSDILGVPLMDSTVSKFADGEINLKLNSEMRGKDVYILQSMCEPVHDNLMECILAVTACRRASARSITVVVPYLAYSRVDRMKPGTTVAAADILKLVETAGADFMLTVDVHRRSAEGFTHTGTDFKSSFTTQEKPCLFDSLESLRLSIPIVIDKDLFNPVIVCPSSTGVTRAKKYMHLLQREGVHGSLAFVCPTDTTGSVEAEEVTCHHAQSQGHMLIGDVANSDVLIIDDMIDTGSRMSIAAEVCKINGAKRVFAFATHGIFSGNCIQTLEDAPLDAIFVTNTIPYRPDKFSRKVMYTSVAPLLAEAIRRKTVGHSLQTLTHM